MDVILKVLEGAKTGAKVAIKKEQFLIGRSQKCHLCVGSTAVSRKHCVILRKDTSVSIKDLGSRNGTLVNDQRIKGEIELSSGDEISVGPLLFQLTISTGINNLKRSKVKSVAEAVERTVSTAGDSSIHEDDITQWLLDSDPTSEAATETQTMRMDDTNAVNLQNELSKAEESTLVNDSDVETEAQEEEEADGKKKKQPGKLPKIKKEPDSKDSGEAASAALRNWNRRH